VVHRRKKLAFGSCSDDQCPSCQFRGIVFDVNSHITFFRGFTVLLCEIDRSRKIVREFWQFAKNGVRMAAVPVMKEHDGYFATSQKCMYDGLNSLLGIRILIRLDPDLFD
jgi:hypothetical protein